MERSRVRKGVPVHLGQYRLVGLVHDGRNSQVWKAQHVAKQGLFAIKMPRDRLPSAYSQIRNLKHQYAVGTRVVHPNIVPVIEFGTEGDLPYLVLEWFPAPNLRVRMVQGLEKLRPLIPRIVHLSAEVVSALHAQGWIHRDIKPSNFLVADDGNVRLIDLALARRKPGLFGRLFRGRHRAQGTRGYMSPEQIRGEALDERADVYSLACTFYELLAGKAPFAGADTHELLNKHLKASPPPLESANLLVTREFSQLIRSAMAKDPAERAASSRDFCRKVQTTVIFRGTNL